MWVIDAEADDMGASMDLHGPTSRVDARIDRVLKGFGRHPFTTAEFIEVFTDTFPQTWQAIIRRYGVGGKGTGTIFTSSSFIGNHLEKRKSNKFLRKLDRVRSPAGWGNPWISVWANLSYARKLNRAVIFPNELHDDLPLLEGAKQTVTVNRYERSAAARADCIRHYGAHCCVCKMDFESLYGPSMRGFIHVHHIKPLSTIGKQYRVDPIVDLRPVCPNCHAVIHACGETLSITKARALVRRATRKACT